LSDISIYAANLPICLLFIIYCSLLFVVHRVS
jgi:hypothetical protein